MACLDTSIGLSQTVCNCFEDMPTGFDTSDSGYYLDELEGLNLNMITAAQDCEQGNVWDLMIKARENAIKDFQGDLLVQIGSLYKKTIENNTYQIGSQKYTGIYTPGTTYAGMRLVPKGIPNGKILLNNIKYIHSTTGVVVNFYIYNNLSSTPVSTFQITTIANSPATSSNLALELPMYVSGEQIEYYIVYETPATGSPMQNKIVCSSCLNWDLKCCDTPCFGNRIVKDQMWNNVLMVGGIKGNNWTELDEASGTSNQDNGLILNLSLNCDYTDIICSNIDYTNGGLPMAIAKSIQLRAGSLLCDYILSSGNINRFMMLDRERLMEKKASYIKEYNSRVMWLAQNIDVNTNGCYQCDARAIYAGILA